MESESVRLLRARQTEVISQLDKLRPKIAAAEAELQQIEMALRVMEGPIPIKGEQASLDARAYYARRANPEIANLTIKEMVVKALGEHLARGATASQLLDFFVIEWGRKEMRTSLSPQLSRLKDSGIIELKGKVWHLAEPPLITGPHHIGWNENDPPEDFESLLGGSDTALDAQKKETME